MRNVAQVTDIGTRHISGTSIPMVGHRACQSVALSFFSYTDGL